MPPALLYFKALSDETRLRLLLVLNRYELNVNELVDILGMGQSRVSRHLKILTGAGLLDYRRDGLWVFYSAVSGGSGRKFIEAIYPFLSENGQFRSDLALAAGIVEDRAAKTRQFFNSIAEEWEHMSEELLGAFELEEIVLAHVPPVCGVAVDLGCGTGSMLEKLLGRAERVIGVDGSARMLELARRRFKNDEKRISLRIGNLEHLPLKDTEADFASMNLVLHHLSNPFGVLQEIKRVLAPGGKFALSEFNQHSDETLRVEYGDHWLGFTIDEIKGILAQSGFELTGTASYPVNKGLVLNFFTAQKR